MTTVAPEKTEQEQTTSPLVHLFCHCAIAFGFALGKATTVCGDGKDETCGFFTREKVDCVVCLEMVWCPKCGCPLKRHSHD